ncbi:hypothetical protein [Pseudomonas soli]|uniref:hypothetical protein n=1 Tax=Pseudomonas soli TaxID=1306993 RepID=UPI003802750C
MNSSSPNIQRLLRKRQLNVQEQNLLTAHRIRESARPWLTREVPPALLRVAEDHGIDWARSLLLDLEFDFPGMPSLTGSLLTDTERFIDFEIETDSSYCHLLSVECWEDVTAQHDHGLRNRGTGKGYATIALETRRELLGLPTR